MSNPMFSSFSGRIKYYKLMFDWDRRKKQNKLDPRIPHPLINYNNDATSSYNEYYQAFVSQACLRELPELLKIADFKENQEELVLLDFGCGLGRLGVAFTNYFGKDLKRQYIGYEIHPSAAEFLAQAYQDYPNTTFLTNKIDLADSYVEIQQKAHQSNTAIAAKNINLSDSIGKKVDLQFSHSVFTHMYPEPITHILKDSCKFMKPNGLCVNTWLIVDQLAESALRANLTDRELPYERDGFFTYSKENPLLCTAYRLDVIEKIYKEAGHKIVDILWGTWSGRLPTQKFTYQDVIISKPI
jgi:SAM-dependent methyltransferase